MGQDRSNLQKDVSKLQAAISVKISNLLVCFCRFELFFLVLEKDNVIKNVYIELSCFIKYHSFFYLVCFNLV